MTNSTVRANIQKYLVEFLLFASCVVCVCVVRQNINRKGLVSDISTLCHRYDMCTNNIQYG